MLWFLFYKLFLHALSHVLTEAVIKKNSAKCVLRISKNVWITQTNKNYTHIFSKKVAVSDKFTIWTFQVVLKSREIIGYRAQFLVKRQVFRPTGYNLTKNEHLTGIFEGIG